MARIRSIHPDACDNDRLGEVSSDAERLYWRLQTHVDDEGRCEDVARLIWARCVPMVRGWDADRVEILLEELHRHGLIVRYEVAARRFLAILKFDRYQHPRRPQASTHPAPPEPSSEPVRTMSEHVATTAELVTPGGEREGRQETGGEVAPEPAGARQRDELFETVAEVCNFDLPSLTKTARGALNKAVKDLRDVGATPEDVRIRAQHYVLKYEGRVDLSPSALAKHWPALATPPPSQVSAGVAAVARNRARRNSR